MSIEYTKDELENAVAKAAELAEIKYPEYLSTYGREFCILGDEVLRLRQCTFDYCEACGWNTKDPDGYCYHCEWNAMIRVLRRLVTCGNESGDVLASIIKDAKTIIEKHNDLILLPLVNNKK